MKRVFVLSALIALVYTLFVGSLSASAAVGTAVAKGAPCFHIQFRDNACSGYVKNGSQLQVLAGGDRWYLHVNYNGRNGYVSANYLTVTTPAPNPKPTPVPTPKPGDNAALKADRIISYAESFIGKVHYKFAVNDPQHLFFDCSAFTKYVFASEGINLIWGSGPQSHQGTPIANIADLHKGDLVHFSVGTPGKINHVGIYIGDNKFIHNTTGSVYGVTISDITNYTKRFIVGTRVISNS